MNKSLHQKQKGREKIKISRLLIYNTNYTYFNNFDATLSCC